MKSFPNYLKICTILLIIIFPQERVQMHEQYKNKVRRLADELLRLEKEESDVEKIFYTKQEELLARKEMVSWEKSNEKIQVNMRLCCPLPFLKINLRFSFFFMFRLILFVGKSQQSKLSLTRRNAISLST